MDGDKRASTLEKKRLKQKRYRDRKRDEGYHCVQLYVKSTIIESLEAEFDQLSYGSQYSYINQLNLNGIPTPTKTDHSTMINYILESKLELDQSRINKVIDLYNQKILDVIARELQYSDPRVEWIEGVLRQINHGINSISIDKELKKIANRK